MRTTIVYNAASLTVMQNEMIKNVVSYLKKFPSYSRKVKYRFLKNSSYLFFTSCFLGEFQ